MATTTTTNMLAQFFTTDNVLVVDSTTATVDNTSIVTGEDDAATTTAKTASRSYKSTNTSSITLTTGNDIIASTHLTRDMTSADDHELCFHYLAHKKHCYPNVHSKKENMYLSDYKSNGSPKSDLLYLCIYTFKRRAHMKRLNYSRNLRRLSLSGIYNYLNPYMKKVYHEKLNKLLPSTIITATTATNSVSEAMKSVRNLLDNEKNMDDRPGIFDKLLSRLVITRQKKDSLLLLH